MMRPAQRSYSGPPGFFALATSSEDFVSTEYYYIYIVFAVLVHVVGFFFLLNFLLAIILKSYDKVRFFAQDQPT